MDTVTVSLLILNYFLLETVNYVIVFNCRPNYENKLLSKLLSNHSILHNIVPTRSYNTVMDIPISVVHEENVHAIVVDECNCTDYRSHCVTGSRPIEDSLFAFCAHRKCFTTNRKWLIIGNFKSADAGDGGGGHTRLANVQLGINGEIKFLDDASGRQENNTVAYRVYDIYNNCNHIGGKLNVTFDNDFVIDRQTNRGYFTASIVSQKKKYENRRALNDCNMRIAYVVTGIPWNSPLETALAYLNTVDNVHIDTYSRYGYRLVRELQQAFRFNITWYAYEWWSVNETSGGAIGSLIDDNIDLIGNPMILSTGRIKYLQAIAVNGHFKSMFAFRTPKSGIINAGFLNPFSSAVWWLLVATILLGCAALKFLFYREKILRADPRSDLSLAFLISFGATCQQGSTFTPHRLAGRILFVAIFFGSTVLFNYYTSLIVSALIGAPAKSNIKTMRQLADSSLAVGIESIPYTVSYLQSHDPEVDYFLRKKSSSHMWLSSELGIQRVRKGGFAYHCEAASGYVLIRRYFEPYEICDLNEVLLRPLLPVGQLVRKDSYFGELFKLLSFRMLETGIQSKYARVWIASAPSCQSNAMVFQVGMDYVGVLFILLAVGIVLSLVIFTCEKLRIRFC